MCRGMKVVALFRCRPSFRLDSDSRTLQSQISKTQVRVMVNVPRRPKKMPVGLSASHVGSSLAGKMRRHEKLESLMIGIPKSEERSIANVAR